MTIITRWFFYRDGIVFVYPGIDAYSGDGRLEGLASRNLARFFRHPLLGLLQLSEELPRNFGLVLNPELEILQLAFVGLQVFLISSSPVLLGK
eukprot:CAMPEP_0170487436 /NCGR_PEP_ID=MMETSP0208-20121228/6253_1 /TAXON_ID=197538 /ORGANISM="Strombidium inclinatum, Strain S3" /LENGTH=92 /DNA_ID=CAMNT_0010761717 /DNA_START=45 /DNA_END=320 /DNA_ORIENTATION=+